MPSVDFDDLFRTTYPRVRAYARTMAGPADADDAVAETYAIAWRRQRDIPQDAALGWLFGVTRRVLANERRSQRRFTALRSCSAASGRATSPIRPSRSPIRPCARRCCRSRRSTARP